MHVVNYFHCLLFKSIDFKNRLCKNIFYILFSGIIIVVVILVLALFGLGIAKIVMG